MVKSLPRLKETSLEALVPTPFLDSLRGAVLLVVGLLSVSATALFIFTDIPVTDFDGCQTLYGYPNIPEIGFAIAVLGITSLIVYAVQNSEAGNILHLNVEVWLSLSTGFIIVMLILVVYYTYSFLLMIGDNVFIADMLSEYYVFTAFGLIFTVAMCIRCVLPTVYHEIYFKKYSLVDTTIREQYALLEKQPFAMEKLTSHAGTELDTEAILLHEAVRSIIELRKSTEDTFPTCEKLAQLVFDNYIVGKRRTLDVYGLRHIVKDVTSPLELIEKEVSVLVPLLEQSREKIMLPLFARMTRQTSTKEIM
jgi:hypothetical protein